MYESTILYNTYILYLLNINCTAYIFIYLISLSTENNSIPSGALLVKRIIALHNSCVYVIHICNIKYRECVLLYDKSLSPLNSVLSK